MNGVTTNLPSDFETDLDVEFLFPKDSRTLWKIVLIGNGAVGKTSIRRRFIGHGFNPVYSATIGADFSTYVVNLGSREIKYQIWDLAGQPHFSEVRQTFYKGTNGALLIYDITNRDSFKNLENWIGELWEHNMKGPIPLILVANKIDLKESGLNLVPRQYAEYLTRKYDKKSRENYGFGIHLIETSARTGENISMAFQILSIQIAVQQRFKQLRMKPS
ncbi:MAG: GTP-binding protein [Candidatus Heimdallarchaeota archaeon]|nr:GTP-binding protein [Candidatus Heimdallarchaeota archaeon]